MPKKYRLSTAEFSGLLKKKPKKAHGSFFSLTHYPLEGSSDVRFGFVIPKKVIPKAAARNTLERRCREVVKKQIPNIKTGRAYIVHAKKDAAKLPFSDIERDLKALLSKVD